MGFMAGFGPAFAAGLERNADRKARKQEILLSSRLKDIQDRTTAYTKAKAEDAANIKLAKSLVEMVPGAPKEVWKDMYNKLSSGVPQSSVLDFYKNVNFQKVEETPAPVETKAPAVEAQMEEAIPTASTEPTVDVSASGVSEAPVTAPDNKPLDFMERLKQRSDERLSAEVDQQAKDILGEDVLEMSEQTYTPTDVGSSGYTTTPKPKKDDTNKPTSFEQMVVKSLQATPGWEGMSPEDKRKKIADAKAALNNTTSSDGTSTLTDGKLAAEIAKYTLMLGSTDPKEVAVAAQWFEKDYPALQGALATVKAIGNTTAPKVLKVKVKSPDGKTKVVEATANPEGGYISNATGEAITDEVLSVQTSDTFDAMTKATTATITLRQNYSNQRTAVVSVAKAGYELDKIARENELVLSKVTGKGVSLFQSGKQELLNIINLLGERGNDQEQGNWLTSSRLINDVNDFVNGKAQEGSYTKEQADQIKLFAAASVRYIFAAGKALGQQGNGFSNQDYKVIRDSIVNSNSYEAFSENLRKFSRERFDEMSGTTMSIQQNGSIKNALNLGADIEFDIMGVEEFLGKVPGYEGVWEWANGSTKDIEPDVLEQLNAEDGE